MSILLWLDDMRPAPAGWVWVKTVTEAKALLETGEVEEASLDRDLYEWEVGAALFSAREQSENGEDLVRWMIATGYWPRCKPRVHSQSDWAPTMERLIEKHWRAKP